MVVCVKKCLKISGQFPNIFPLEMGHTDNFYPKAKNPLGTFLPRISGQTRDMWGFNPGQYLANNTLIPHSPGYR